ncbi:MAG: LysM peptidoglycan-binding domain-containing protein, partial [Tannerellaceae bacterium]
MNRSKIWLLSFLLTFVGIHAYSQVAGNGKTNSDTFTHTIERGQTVYAIATMYGVTPEDIYKLNPTSKTVIKIGDKLIIPQKRTDLQDTQEQAYTFHTIAPKETLYSLSRSNNVTPQQIIEENPGLTAATFKIGRTIRIPQSSTNQTTTVIKEVKKPDIEYKIKKKE